MVSFNLVPNNVRVPFVALEFDPSQANQGPALLAYNALISGQKLNTGSAVADSVVRCASVADAITAGGRGSMLHRQAIGWFASNQSTALRLGVLADNNAGVAATGTIVFTAAATSAGTIPFYLGGVLVTVGVGTGDATTALATNTAAAINANPDLPVTATVNASTVTVVFRHKGLTGNGYDVRANYNPGDVAQNPAGAAWTITPLSGGTTAPSLTNLIAGMATQWFELWTHPYTDATSLTAIEGELLSRAGPLRSIDGLAITSAAGSFSSLATLGNSRNSPYSSIVAQPGANPLTPPMEFAAEVAALVAGAGSIDPARPFQTLAMSNALPVAPADEFTPFPQRNLLLFDGVATTRNAPGGVVQLDRIITTYQSNPSGQPDTAYLDSNTILTLQYLRYDFRTQWANAFPRHKLADDGTLFGSGQAVVTPSIAKAWAVGWFIQKQAQGLVENVGQFIANLVVQRNQTDPNRLDFLLPPNLINQLVVTAANVQFRL